MYRNDYLQWLMNQCQLTSEGPEGYSRLCRIMQSVCFLSLIEFDENRSEEGKDLRYEWAEDTGGDISSLNESLSPYTCTMLELILILARRMDYEMMDSQYEAGVGKWVMELLGNAGLATFRNDYCEAEQEYSENRIRCVLNDIICRRYMRDGEGGFFPLQRSPKDQRTTELLTQMNYYLAENYDIC